jgi:hypothetical protein
MQREGAPAADFSARGCPHRTKLCTAHYFIIRNLSESFPPFGRRVGECTLRQVESTIYQRAKALALDQIA